MACFVKFEEVVDDGSYRDRYPDLLEGYANGTYPRPESSWNPRCPNKVRYEMMKRLGYFVTESSEHFAEYTPWFIKEGRDDLIEKFKIPLDEYPKRCIEQMANWDEERERLKTTDTIEIKESHEYASEIVNSIWTGKPSVIDGDIGVPLCTHSTKCVSSARYALS